MRPGLCTLSAEVKFKNYFLSDAANGKQLLATEVFVRAKKKQGASRAHFGLFYESQEQI